MRISVLLVAASMLIAAPAFAQIETAPPPASAEGGASAPEAPAPTQEPTAEQAPAFTEAVAEPELVCRTLTERTESRLRSRRERVCKTQAEWDAQEAASNRSRSSN